MQQKALNDQAERAFIDANQGSQPPISTVQPNKGQTMTHRMAQVAAYHMPNLLERHLESTPLLSPVAGILKSIRTAKYRPSKTTTYSDLTAGLIPPDEVYQVGEGTQKKLDALHEQIRAAAGDDEELYQKAINNQADIKRSRSGNIVGIRDRARRPGRGLRNIGSSLKGLFRDKREAVSPLSFEEELQYENFSAMAQSDEQRQAISSLRDRHVQALGGYRKPRRQLRFGRGLNKLGTVGLGAGLAASQFLPQYLEGSAGTYEHPGAGGIVGVTRTKQAVGALSGAASGAAVGSFFGPVGTAIGALAGSFHGLTQATQEATKELAQLGTDKALTKLDSLLGTSLNGTGPISKATSGQVSTGLRELDISESRKSAQENRSHFGNDFIGNAGKAIFGRESFIGRNFRNYVQRDTRTGTAADADNSYNSRQEFLKENVAPRLGQLRAYSEKLASQVKVNPLLLSTNNQIPGAEEGNRKARIAAFNRAGGGEVASRIVEATPGLTIEAFNREMDKVIVEANRERIAHESLTKVIVQQELQIQKFSRIGQAIDATVSAFGNLQHGTDALEASFNGQISATPVHSHIAALSNLGGTDTEAYNKGVDFVTGGVGGRAENPLVANFGDTAKAINRTANVLPTVISQAAASGGDDEALPKLIGEKLSQQIGDSDISKVITDRVKGLLNGMKPEEVAKAAGENAQKLADGLIKDGFANVNEVLQNAAKALEERANAFNSGLVKNQEMINRIGESQDKYANLQVKAAQSGAELQAEMVGRPGQAQLSVQSQLAPFQARQERLTSVDTQTAGLADISANVTPGEANSPEEIGRRLQSVQRATQGVREIRDQATSPKEQDQTSQALAALQGSAQRLGQALEHLADPVEKQAILAEKLNRLEESRNAKLSFTEKLATASPLELARMRQNANASDLAVHQGTLTGLTQQQREGALEHLGSLGEATLPGYGNRKASDIRRQLVTNTALQIGTIKPGEQNEILDVKRQQHETDKTAVTAQGEIVKNQQSLQGQFFNELISIQREFFNKLDASLLEATKRDVAAQTGEAASGLAKAQKASEAEKTLKTKFGLTAEQAQSIRGRPELETITDTEREKGLMEQRFGDVAKDLTSHTGKISELASDNSAGAYSDLTDELVKRLGTTHKAVQTQIFSKFTPGAGPEALQSAIKQFTPLRAGELNSEQEKAAKAIHEQLFPGRQYTKEKALAPLVDLASHRTEVDKLAKGTDDKSSGEIAYNLQFAQEKVRAAEEAQRQLESHSKALEESKRALPPMQQVAAPGPTSIPTPQTDANLLPVPRVSPRAAERMARRQDRLDNRPIRQRDIDEQERVTRPFVAVHEDLGQYPPGEAPAAQTRHLMTRELPPAPPLRAPTVDLARASQAEYATQKQAQEEYAAGVSQQGGRGRRRAAIVRQQISAQDRKRGLVPPPVHNVPPVPRRQDQDAPRAPSNNMASLQQNIQSLGGIFSGFDKTISNMNSTLSNLANIFKDMKIPDKITLERNGRIEVVHNGAQLYTALKGDYGDAIKNDVLTAVKEQLPSMMKEITA